MTTTPNLIPCPVHVIVTGGGRDRTHEITTPEIAARLLADVSGNERDGFADEIAAEFRAGYLSAYEATDEHGRTFLVAPEGSPHLYCA